MFELKSRPQVIEKLKTMHDRGYRWVVRDKDMPYLCCYSIKPKRYRDIDAWGYADPYARGAVPAYPIKNTDITEINYNNRSATAIYDFILDNERGDGL